MVPKAVWFPRRYGSQGALCWCMCREPRRRLGSWSAAFLLQCCLGSACRWAFFEELSKYRFSHGHFLMSFSWIGRIVILEPILLGICGPSSPIYLRVALSASL
jgi:hypothetical protein